MTTGSKPKSDFRAATESKKVPKAAVDGVAGMILAYADVSGTPDQAFRALTTNEVEKWWRIPGVYHLKDWQADLHVQGRWSVTVELNDGKQLQEWGEFCELDIPNKIVMTRRFGGNPLLEERETTLTYRFVSVPHGTLVTLREEGFIGRSEAAYGNAENWEKVLGLMAVAGSRWPRRALRIPFPWFRQSEGKSAGGSETRCAFTTEDIEADHTALQARGRRRGRGNRA